MTAGAPAHRAVSIQDALLAAAASAAPFGCRVHVFDTVTSTNDIASRMATDGAAEGTLIVAGHQTRGRGRRGATFVSPAGSGLYLSTILRPSTWPSSAGDAIGVAGAITLMAGVAVVQAARAVGAATAELKWPNDVVVSLGPAGWRKLAGVLTEASTDATGALVVVLGIGVNVTEAPPDAGLARIATALSVAAGRSVRVEETASALVSSLGYAWRVLAFHGRQPIVDAWRRHAPSLAGRAVTWVEGHRLRSGRAMDIDDRGALRVETAEGTVALVAGDVAWDARDA